MVLPPPPPARKLDKAELAKHYFGKGDKNRQAGEHTMLIRTVFAEVQKKQKRKYGGVIAALAALMLGIGGFALFEHQQVAKQRGMAIEIFYSMKSLDVDIANLRDAVKSSNNQQGMDQLKKIEEQRGQMENSYDHYLATLKVYSPKMSEQDRLVLRVSRIFGECELDMPPDFVAEVEQVHQDVAVVGPTRKGDYKGPCESLYNDYFAGAFERGTSAAILLSGAAGERLRPLHQRTYDPKRDRQGDVAVHSGDGRKVWIASWAACGYAAARPPG